MGTFKTKARAVELLGKKQIRDSVTALAEIMKNSYDADAELLRVEFLTKDIKTPCIVICDTGVGMNQQDLEDKWLVLGTPSKLESKKKQTPMGRALMGEKGIGRLAVSRLGQQMWMFTKKKDTGWNVLYINWNIFENPDLFIEDIVIPVTFNRDFDELSQMVNELKGIQSENLDNPSWELDKNINKRRIIKRQITESELDMELVYDFGGIIEENKIKQGTMIFSLNLNDDWDRYLDRTIASEEDVLAIRNYNRLNSFMSDFAPNEKNFYVELSHNNQPLVFTARFDDQDYELYDLKIEGYVEQGIFKGHIDARNSNKLILDKCNEILKSGISVTAGIGNWQKDDCGKYTVKLCHFEMKESNTGLTVDEQETIIKRMKGAGGIGVYRDNVRVLPYGEPENDFLELEERRSRSAKYYLFSHRNMFGRIDITSSANPNLEDKSSREGLIENQYYYYFIKTLQNLLIKISVDFLYDKGKSLGLRSSYVEYNKIEAQRKNELKRFEKEQEQLFRQDKKRVEDLLKNNPSILVTLKKEIELNLQKIRKECGNPSLFNYKKVLEQISELEKFLHESESLLSNKQKQLYIRINERFESKYPLKLFNDVDIFNEELDNTINELRVKNRGTCKALKQLLDERIQQYHNDFSREQGCNVEDIISDLNLYLKKVIGTLHELSDSSNKDIIRKHDLLMEKVKRIEDYQEEIYSFKKNLHDGASFNYNEIEQVLFNLRHKIKNIDASIIFDEIGRIRSDIEECELKIYNLNESINKKASAKYDSINQKLDTVLERFKMKDSQLINQLIIQNNQLKELNDMYADLANMGMAAEIVSHEFNQLFNNVYDAINQLRYQSMSGDGKYYLNQIDVGFRAISDRMNQLSPMYRSKSLYKKKVNIYDMLQDIYRFFENRLTNQQISFTIDVPKDLEIKLSLSKVYPILSNLVYNSIFWVSDKAEKNILFHFVEDENALYVEDSGSGISIRNKERVFEPFFSLKKNGRGLGLSISKNVLEAQGHEIEVVTDSPNKQLEGACLKITFSTEAKV